MVGPGLFFALALSAGPVRAETAVGLDAQGVDPAVAVDNRYGLDIRDENGRPVTAEKVLSDLKAVSVARARDAAVVSSVRQARSLVSALELLEKADLFLGAAMISFRLPAAVAAAPAPGPKLSAVLMILMAVTAPAFASLFCCRRPPALLLHTRQNRPEVLLC